MTIRVRAPASTANLGPGFDCLGGAITLDIEVDVSPSDAYPDGLVGDAIRAVTDARGDVVIRSDVPVGRGLGSSAACIAAGLLAGCALAGRDVDPGELLRIGTPLEGHPDNLAASLFGGITLVVPGHGVMRFDPSPSVRPVIVLPDRELSTAEARRVLPNEVPRADAVANIARTAGLISILTGSTHATVGRLLACTRDLIHQPYRAPLMPETAAAIDHLRERGIPAAVSGAGPSVVCLVVRGEEQGVHEAATALEGWRVLELDWDSEGAKVTSA